MSHQYSFDEILRKSLDIQLGRVVSLYPEYMSEKGYRELPAFFREYLYAPDLRRKQVETVENLRARIKVSAGEKVSKSLDNLMELARISDEIDNQVAAEIESLLKEGRAFDLDTVEIAIRRVKREDFRRKQIIFTASALSFFHSLTKMTYVKLLLSPIKIACHVFGAGFLVEVIEEGYRVAREIENIDPFIDAFRKREIDYLRGLFPESDIQPIAESEKVF